MTGASTLESMSPELRKVAERARREPDGQFHSLAHLINEAALARSFDRLRKDAAVGVDGLTKEQYAQDLGANLRNLHERLKAGRYRHQPIRRVHIPKEPGKTRPIGISATEDKVVQGALREVLEAIYEQDFKDCSHGFRPRRSAHDAVRALKREMDGGRVEWILEADIVSFFDSVDRTWLMKMLQKRVADRSIHRLVGKCLHVGVLDGAAFSEPEIGTAQGSVISPLLGNLYLHYVVDIWFERRVKPVLQGRATLVRYADDLVMTFQNEDDARRVHEALIRRMTRFNLNLHPEKTRLIPFARPPQGKPGKGPSGFDFLGFTWFWRKTRSGGWTTGCKTRTARLTRAIGAAYDFCRRHRHESIKVQQNGLAARLRGHFNYFGVNGNSRCLHALREQVQRIWYKWLRRRSQRSRLDWDRFRDLLRDFPLPTVRVFVQIWNCRSASHDDGRAGWFMWRSRLCCEAAPSPRSGSITGASSQHNLGLLGGLQGCQEGHQFRVRAPAGHPMSWRFCLANRARLERGGPHLEIHLRVAVRGLQGHVAQPGTDGVDVDAGAEEMHRCGVPDGVRADAFALQRGDRRRSLLHGPGEQRVDAEASHGLAADVEEDPCIARPLYTGAQEFAQYVDGVCPEWARPRFAALAEQVRRRSGPENEVTDGDARGFGGSCTGVVEEQEQRVVAASLGPPAIRRGQQRVDLVLVEIRHDGCRRATVGNRPDLHGLLDEFGHLSTDETEERVNGCQALVASGNRVAASIL